MDENSGGTPNPLNPNLGSADQNAQPLNYFDETMTETLTEPAANAEFTDTVVMDYSENNDFNAPANYDTANHNYPATDYAAMDYDYNYAANVSETANPAPDSISTNSETVHANHVLETPVYATTSGPKVMDSVIRRNPNHTPENTTHAQNMAVPVAGVGDAGSAPILNTSAPTTLPPVSKTPDAPASPATQTAPATPATTETPAKKPKKKSKAGLIIGIILLVIAMICGGVAAALMLFPQLFQSGDRVATAMTRLIERKTPSNLALTGKIILNNSEPNHENPIETLIITVDSELATAQNAGSSTFEFSATMANDTSIDLEVDEIHTEDGDLYLRVRNLDSIIDAMDSQLDENITTMGNMNCLGDDEYNCMPAETWETYSSELFGSLTGIFDVVDNEWLRIPSDAMESLGGSGFSLGGFSLGNLGNPELGFSDLETEMDFGDYESALDAGSLTPTLGRNPTQCVVNTMADLGSYGSEIASLYKNNPFVTYSTDNLGITAKRDTLYRLGLDETIFTNFVNSLTSSKLMKDLANCVGINLTTQSVSVSDVQAVLSNLPTVYVEIDDNYNFTRLYFEASGLDSEEGEISADFSISYPSSPITITTPAEYIDLNELLQTLMMQIFGDLNSLEE